MCLLRDPLQVSCLARAPADDTVRNRVVFKHLPDADEMKHMPKADVVVVSALGAGRASPAELQTLLGDASALVPDSGILVVVEDAGYHSDAVFECQKGGYSLGAAVAALSGGRLQPAAGSALGRSHALRAALQRA